MVFFPKLECVGNCICKVNVKFQNKEEKNWKVLSIILFKKIYKMYEPMNGTWDCEAESVLPHSIQDVLFFCFSWICAVEMPIIVTRYNKRAFFMFKQCFWNVTFKTWKYVPEMYLTFKIWNVPETWCLKHQMFQKRDVQNLKYFKNVTFKIL